MKVYLRKTKRFAYSVTAVAVTAAMTVPYLVQSVSAASLQMGARSIQPSSSVVSAGNVQYKVSFTIPDASTLGSIAIDFCDSPIPGDACGTPPVGLNVNRATTGLYSGTNLPTGAAVNASAGANHTIVIKGTATSSPAANTVVSFTLGNGTNGFTNPSGVGSYYARIHTYATLTGADTHTAGATSGFDDYGGVALSTANPLTVTAKVQEQLSFCIYTAANCVGGLGPVNLGDSGVLASDAVTYTDVTAKFELGTNAQTGAIVRMKGDTLKTTSGAFNIAATGASCATDVSAALTDERFGMRISTPGAGHVAQAPYNCAAGSHGFDATTACTAAAEENVTCAYGDRIATTNNLPIAKSSSVMEFAAKAATATEAGIYSTSLGFIATGTF